MTGAIGRALVILPRWQPVSPVHAVGSGRMVPHGVTPWWISGLRDAAVGTPCVCTPPWIGIAQLMILLAVNLQKGVFQLDASL